MVIPVNGLANGRTEYSWKLDGSFFSAFDNSEIKDARIEVVAEVEKSGRFIGVEVSMNGEVVVECDRCLEDLTLPIDTQARLSIKFGATAETAETDDREIITLPDGEAELDMDQIVYDYCCLDLPVQRVHEEGGCNPEVLRHLADEDEIKEEQPDGPMDSPFAALKALMEKSNSNN